MSTAASGSAPYCTAAQFVNDFDWRTLAQLLDDTGGVTPLTTSAAVQASTTLAQFLQDASGELEAAVLIGNRYSVADLQTSNGNSQVFLAGIVAGITLEKFPQRRPGAQLPKEWLAVAQKARGLVAAIADGQRILAFTEVMDAGEQVHDIEGAADVQDRNLTTYELERAFGRRNNRQNN